MFFSTQTPRHSCCLLMMQTLLVGTVVIFMLCTTLNGSVASGHLLALQALFDFLLATTAVCAMENIITTSMHLFTGDRRYRRDTAVVSFALETLFSKLMGELMVKAGSGKEESGKEGSTKEESTKEETAETAKEEEASQGTENADIAFEKLIGDSESAASGANTHVVQ